MFKTNFTLQRLDEIATRFDTVRGGDCDGGAIRMNETHDDRHGAWPLPEGDVEAFYRTQIPIFSAVAGEGDIDDSNLIWPVGCRGVGMRPVRARLGE